MERTFLTHFLTAISHVERDGDAVSAANRDICIRPYFDLSQVLTCLLYDLKFCNKVADVGLIFTSLTFSRVMSKQ